MSPRNDNYSEEFLNAFVDDQLTAQEKAEAYSSIHQSRELSREVCELRKVRDLVQLAYKELPTAPDKGMPLSGTRRRGRAFAAGLAASVALVMGVLAGNHLGISKPAGPENTAHSDVASGQQMASAAEEQIKILIHLNSGDKSDIADTLTEIEQLFHFYKQNNQQVRVELVTNGGGLALVRSDVSPFVERVKEMQRKYDNLSFVACQNSIDRLKEEQGITAKLIPGTVVIDSGVAQIMRRQHQGWAYIRV